MRTLRGKLTYANVTSTLCLFLLLGGGAYAAIKLPKNSVGSKQIKPNAVNGSKVKDRSLTGADIDASSLGKVPRASHADGADSLQGHPASDFLGANATAANSNKLGGLDPADVGSVMSAQTVNVPSTAVIATRFGPASGVGNSSATEGQVDTLSPQRAMIARDLSVRLSQAPGGSNQVNVAVIVNGGIFTSFFCKMSGSQTSCSDVTDTAPVPGGSTLVVQLIETPTTTIPALSALVGFRLTPN